jgi:hypothetical protein
MCILVLQSLAEQTQARAGLVREAADVHEQAIAAREASLQDKIEAAQEVKRVKEAMARQVEKELASLKKKLEVAEQKAKDAADDFLAVVEGKFAKSLSVDSMCLLGLFLIFQPWMSSGAKVKEDTLKKELAETKDHVRILNERATKVRGGE